MSARAAPTCNFEQTVIERVERDPAFAQAASLATSDKGQKAAAAGFKVPLWEVPAAAD